MSIFIWNSEIKNAYIWTTPVKEIFVGTTKVRPAGWKPWANTIAYYPLTANANDESWNGNNGTANWVSFSTYDWVDCAYFDWSVYTKIQLPWLWSFSEITMVIRAKTTYSLPSVSCLFMLAPSTDNKNMAIQWNNSKFILSRWNWSSAYDINDWTANDWIWHCVVATKDSSAAKLYVDGTLIWQDTRSSSVQSDSWHSAIWWHATSTNAQFIYKWYLSNSIIENKARTADEISDYYNQTKSNYWL